MGWKSRLPLGLAIAFIVVAPAIFGSFTITLMNYIGIYAFAVLGLVLLTGVGGLTSFGQAAFVGIGAYATAWYTAVHGGSPWIGLLLALLLTGLVATILGAATLAGLSGWLYAHMQRYVSPAPFDIRPSIELLLMALVGGAGHIAGAVVGAAAITLLKNALQDVLPLFTRYSAQLEVVAFGVLFVVILQKA